MTLQPSLSKSSRSSDTSSKRGLSDPEKSSSLFLLLIALAVLLGSVKLGLGTIGSPGPGFLPFLAAVVLAFSSGIHFLSKIFSNVQRPNGTVASLWVGAKWRKVIYVVLALVIYSIFIEEVGFIVCTFLVMMVLLLVMEVKHWYTVLIGGALVALISYVVFEKLLAVGFPIGIFGF
jgi:putative tricarboxylic transport membrane protein